MIALLRCTPPHYLSFFDCNLTNRDKVPRTSTASGPTGSAMRVQSGLPRKTELKLDNVAVEQDGVDQCRVGTYSTLRMNNEDSTKDRSSQHQVRKVIRRNS